MSDHGDDFAATLRAAIAARGLSLDQIRAELRRLDTAVSVATLSYWQSGRSRPVRAASLAALGPLEQVLGVRRGHLARRVAFRRYEESVGPDDTPLEVAADEDHPVVDAVAEELGLGRDDGLDRVGVHDRLRLDGDGAEVAHEVRLVLRARRSGASSLLLWDEEGSRQEVRAGLNCRVGRVEAVPRLRCRVVEILLERPLRQGESIVLQYEFVAGDRRPRTHFVRAVTGRVREFIAEVSFEANPPGWAERFSVVDGDEMTTRVPVTPPLLGGFVDAEAGFHGLRWGWGR